MLRQNQKLQTGTWKELALSPKSRIILRWEHIEEVRRKEERNRKRRKARDQRTEGMRAKKWNDSEEEK